MLDERRRDDEGEENAEEAALHVDLGGADFPIGEGVEEAGDDVEGELADEVFRGAPVCDERSLNHCTDLGAVWHSVFSVVRLLLALTNFLPPLFDEALDLVLALLRVLGLGPFITPVFALIVWITGTDRFKHVFGWVLVLATLLSSIGFEVVDQVFAVLAKLTVVDNSTT